MAKRVARKIKRAGKTAFQFSFTSIFEYIDLECKGSWRPDNLKVIWLRNHRRAQSINVEWICTDDRGPNGASGRAVFDPPISATLIVTLYKDSKQKKGFEEKEYKYYIENEGPTGKKILASFTCDMAEYAEVPSSRHALEMNFKPISTKVRKCHLGVTLDSKFTKQGNPNDDDMQSTFSADVGGEDNKLVFADEEEDDIDEDDLDEAATLGAKIISNMTNTDEKGNVEASVIMLGTGETLKRSDINAFEPPKKPPRTNSVIDLLEDSMEQGDNINTQPMNEDNNDRVTQEQTQQETSTVSSNEQLTDSPNHPEHNTQTEPSTVDIQTESNIIATQSITTDIQSDSNTTVTQPESNVTQSESQPESNTTQPESNTTQSESNTTQPESQSKSNTTQPESNTTQFESNTTQPESNTTQSKSNTTQSESNTTQSDFDTTRSKSDTTQSESNTTQSESNTTRSESNTTQSESNTTQSESNTLVGADLVGQSREADLTPPTDPVTDFQVSRTSSNADTDTKPPSSTQEDTTTTASTGTADTTEEQPQVVQQTQQTNATPPTDTTSTSSTEVIPWLPDIELVDYMDKPLNISRISSTDVIAFYFSASWCPPCKTFLPNLKKFYNALKENNKSFEIVYVSSDYSREEMVAYMNDTTMPWTAVRYGHKLADKLRQDYSVRVIPILVVVSRSGDLIDENAKKQVDKVANGMSPTAACIQLFNKWVDKMNNVDTQEDEGTTTTTTTTSTTTTQKSGAGAIMSTIKKALSKDEDKKSLQGSTDELREATESKTPKSKINTGGNKDELLRQLQEKENIIRQLEEVNLSLKHTNDDLNTEVRNLKARIELQNDELKSLKETDEQQKKDDEMFKEYLKLQGWLFKRGIKGPTANKWRRRYFRLDQGSKLYYYKNHTEGTPQGHVDLLKVIEVKELTAAQQDKNNASFNIVCEGRTYQLQAYDEAEMRRWITAIGKVKEFYLKQQSVDASAN